MGCPSAEDQDGAGEAGEAAEGTGEDGSPQAAGREAEGETEAVEREGRD